MLNMNNMSWLAQDPEAVKDSKRFVRRMERWAVRFSRLIKWFPPATGVLGSGVAGYYMLKAHRHSLIGSVLSLAFAIKDLVFTSRGIGFAVALTILQILTQMSLCHRMKMASRHLIRPLNKGQEVRRCICLVGRLNERIWSPVNAPLITCFGACALHLIVCLVTGNESPFIRAFFASCAIWSFCIINSTFHLSQAIINEVSYLHNGPGP